MILHAVHQQFCVQFVIVVLANSKLMRISPNGTGGREKGEGASENFLHQIPGCNLSSKLHPGILVQKGVRGLMGMAYGMDRGELYGPHGKASGVDFSASLQWNAELYKAALKLHWPNVISVEYTLKLYCDNDIGPTSCMIH
jgi:hypothetical protein